MAIWSWRNTAISEYGVFYGDEKIANERNGVAIERCARSGFGLMICEAKGRPCAEQTELECTHNDRQDCDPKIKSIQSKLDAKGYSVGAIDGIRGPKLDEAIKEFKKEIKKENKIADSSIKEEIEALNK